MIYEIGSKGLTPIGTTADEPRNKLPIGTVLQLNGYNNPQYVIVKNLGISEKFEFYGTKYLCVSLDDYSQGIRQAYELKYISQKQDDRIAVYITDEVKTPEEVFDLWEKSEAKEKNTNARQKLAEENRARLIEEGKKLFAAHIPADAKALIIAEHDQDESDIQTDYFGHRTIETVILGYSAHTKDDFREMRKAALKLPETKHLGPGQGHFKPRVVIDTDEDFVFNGSCYHKGQYSPWHSDLDRSNGYITVFSTKTKADEYIIKKGQPKYLSLGNRLISFSWRIEEENLEHREKYSMGAGYYLKSGGRNSTGWSVKKIKKYSAWRDEYYISIAKRCVF